MNKDSKKAVQSDLRCFSSDDLSQNAIRLFSTLGYNTQRQNPLAEKTFAGFRDSFLTSETRFRGDKALVTDWKSIDLLFQLTKEEVSDAKNLFDTKKVNNTIIEAYLFFAIELEKSAYSRTALAQICREINRIFPMPVMLVFKYGEHLTLSMINRRLHKKDESKDVLEKVTLIKDISIAKPHRAHVEILFDLSFEQLKQVHGFTNFVELHNAWQKTLDTKELSKRFFQELANWYFWSAEHVSFPDDMEKNRDIRNATSLIRLITRIIFIWFIKEKNLVPEKLFNPDELNSVLKDFSRNSESKNYYNAILQNLFFACLNQKMNERKFAKDGTLQENKTEYGVKTLFRYSDMFAVPEDQILKLFENIPFLNGGLFDCLDRPDEDGRILYADGFSRNPKKQAIVPDFLFFGKEQECDLNAVFGTKNRKYRVKGLIPLLESYKFTVAENTPVEEEIALDPELLGKIFENLLASYNPETQTTARKQTGSFYTPREIVSYMVDESLTAYLKQKLEAHKSENTESRLRDLFSYSENPNPFDEKETQILINAIDNCRILDPACGSGAFPMGILHKMVHVLHKLDPQNRLWKERQMAKVDRLIKDAGNINDSAIRDKIVADLENSRRDIEESFASNELDYGRKLYLIESCIYGVDIQPVAIQISKLRFFISLIVDQRITRNKENFGVRSLPNLETKFVAANTLIGLDKPKQKGLKNPELEKLEKEMKELRNRYFSAKSRTEKLNCQKKDRELRNSISEFLIKDGWDNESAKQLSAFDPYDQNAGSGWFDAEWMFGIKDGFDVVIGNPPYVSTRTKDFDIKQKKYYKAKYRLAVGQYDLFTLFIEKANIILTENGILVFIVPKRLLSNENFEGARNMLLNDLPICTYLDAQMPFAAAGVEANVIISTRNTADKVKTFIFDGADIKPKYEVDYRLVTSMPFKIFPFAIHPSNIHIIDLILKNSKDTFGNNLDIIRGMECGFNHPAISKQKTKFKIIKGEHISKFIVKETDFCLNPDKVESKIIKSKDIYTKIPKLLTKFVSNTIDIAFDGIGYFNTNVVYNMHPKKGKEKFLKYFMLLGNSKLINFWFFNTYANDDKLFPHIQKNQLDSIPLIFSNELKIFDCVAEFVLLTACLKAKTILQFFQSITDAMVYELYFYEKIKSADAKIMKHLKYLPELKENLRDEKKLAVAEKVYYELSDSEHPVTAAMKKQKTVPEIRIIEGLDK